jgi:hypothetical protein
VLRGITSLLLECVLEHCVRELCLFCSVRIYGYCCGFAAGFLVVRNRGLVNGGEGCLFSLLEDARCSSGSCGKMCMFPFDFLLIENAMCSAFQLPY